MRYSGFIALALIIPAGVSAQETGEEAVIQRETFEYPATGRRDPFAPLIYSPERGSIVVLVDQATLRRYRVWEGDMIGGARLLAVKETEAEFLVTVFGVSRRDTLRLKSKDKEQGP